jgi:hypothetical protein
MAEDPVRISELPETTTPAGSDIIPLVQGGVTKRITRTNFFTATATSPGGSDKNAQYNDNGAFGGVTNNSSATNKFLRQVSSGTPAMEQVADADLSVTDITTNNASTSAHGFVIKATAPSSGIRNVVAIDNSETVYKNTALFDTTNPAALGTAAPGTSLIAARRDHVHANLVDGIEFIIDGGGGSTITTGIKGDLEIPFACTINQATLLADQSGSIVVDIWKDTYANFPPTGADSITASAKPTISTATKSQDATLTGWTTSITAGDILRFNVDSITTCTRVTLSLKVTRT